jgi:tRNA(fMet)-specific endonuclease VapC
VSGLVVDTSVWIDFFSGRPVPALEDGLAQGAVALPPIVVAELVSGARQERQRAAILDLVGDLPVHETPIDHWIRVGDLRRRLAEKGVAVSTPDAHVAQCAIDRDALLLTRDDVFKKIARATALRVAAGARPSP